MNILLSEEDCHAHHKEPFRNSWAKSDVLLPFSYSGRTRTNSNAHFVRQGERGVTHFLIFSDKGGRGGYAFSDFFSDKGGGGVKHFLICMIRSE